MNEHQTLRYPTGKVVGIVRDHDDLDATIEGLHDAGVDDARIAVWRGPDEADLAPDPSEVSGALTTVVRAAQKVLGDETERLKQLEEALAAGHDVLCVSLTADEDDDAGRDAEKATIRDALHRHGARDIAYYGAYQIQQLDAGATS